MFNSLHTNFYRLNHTVNNVILSLKSSASDKNSPITCEDIQNDNKLIYGVYKIMEPCVLRMNFMDALNFIYRDDLRIPKPETITRCAKKEGIRFYSHPSNCDIKSLMVEVFKENPKFYENLPVNELLIGIFKKINPEILERTFGEILLTADLPSIDTIIRAGRGFRKGE